MFIKPSFPDIGNKAVSPQSSRREKGATRFKVPDIGGEEVLSEPLPKC